MFKIILILVLGSLGGLLAEKALMPYLSGSFLVNNRGTTIINKTERIVVQENNAYKEAIQKIKSSIVLINHDAKSAQTGFIVSSDGLIATVYPAKTGPIIISWRDKNFSASVFRQEPPLLFLKIDSKSLAGENLPVVSFSDAEPNLGERVFLVTNNFINDGIIKTFDKKEISTNIKESNSLVLGSPLVNLKGEVMAINYNLNKEEFKSFIIRDLTNFFR